jgi:GDP-L-fucose synthase
MCPFQLRTEGNRIRVFVAGHRGMVDGAILRQLGQRRTSGATIDIITRARSECDPSNQEDVRYLMLAKRPDVVNLAAAKVGGIHPNSTYPADFIYENLMIECNVIHQAFRVGVQKLLQLGSSRIYPKAATQPMP